MAKAAGKATGKLKALQVQALVADGKPGAHADGGNLYLRVVAPGAAKWTLRFMLAGRAREMGLGAFDGAGKAGLTLAQAREAAEAPRAALRAGLDPIEDRDRKAREAEALAAQTPAVIHRFEDVAAEHIAAHSPGWRNAKHRAQWTSTLATYAYPVFGQMAVEDITTEHVLKALQAIWTDKPETASRLRGRIESVIDHAMARGWRTTPNPARWRGHLANLLPPRSKVRRVKHHAALPWQEIPDFMARLRQQPGTAALALQFCILTATRTGETIGARWSEIDLDAAVWTLPPERMKAGRAHRVPLSDAALAVLATMAPLRPADGDGYVFPGARDGRPLSSMAMLMLLRRMKRADLTTHGFRSAFRDWCEEATSTPHAVAEQALAHAVENKVEAAYRRGDLFQKRAVLMRQWAEYCGKAPTEIVTLPTAAEAVG
jgi:integrase